ncbi:MAG: hypothetical protein KDA22_00860 [Phycisphaerales bacterium]|nr:hypothetical protein [Phycisphaerales bacterium]
MLLYAGIDEAGYGPMLGPLCVAATAFVVEEHDPASGPPDLWRLLSKAVCRRPSDRRRRVAIDDSKKLKTANDGPSHPLRHLERGVLAVLAGIGDNAEDGSWLPATDADLFDRLSVGIPKAADVPWYASPTTLPLAHTAGELSIAAAMVRRACQGAGVRGVISACEVIDAAQFNELLERFGNKATVNFGAVTRLIDRIWKAWPGCHPRIVVDRQGGRAFYRQPLQMTFPEAFVTVLGETDSVSRYRLEQAGSQVTISFESESEQRHLPAALASMTAKYVRELLMGRLNRFFQGYLPEIKPTAGYVQDGRRYVEEIAPVIDRLRIDRSRLVRRA